jgi:hypothetical protein
VIASFPKAGASTSALIKAQGLKKVQAVGVGFFGCRPRWRFKS